MKMYDITPEAFRAWLEQNLRKRVGLAVKAGEYPISRFVKATDPRAKAKTVLTVGTTVAFYEAGVPGGLEYLPAWAAAFALELDTPRKPGAPVTGQAAIKVLETVLARAHSPTPPWQQLRGLGVGSTPRS